MKKVRLETKTEIRTAALNDITREMVKYGQDRDWSILWRSKYSAVKKPTWYRWVNEVKGDGVAGRKAAKAVKAKAKRDSQLLSQKNIVQELSDTLPEIVRPGDIANTGIIAVMDEINKAISRANRVIDICETADGRIRNPKMYLAASKHSLEALRTAAQVADQLMNAQKADRFLTAVFDCINDVDRELAERIVVRMRDLNDSWGSGLAT